MPEGVAKDAREEAKAKAKEASPRRKPSGNVARVKVELLDGSTMDLEVDVSTFILIFFAIISFWWHLKPFSLWSRVRSK